MSDRPVLAAALARMQQHVLDDGIGALAVLHDLFQIVLQKPRQLIDFGADLLRELSWLEHVVQLVSQFGRKGGEIVDEVERVLDLMRDAGGELAERSEFFGLHQAVLRGAEVVEGFGEIVRALAQFVEQAGVLDRDNGLVCEVLQPSRSASR